MTRYLLFVLATAVLVVGTANAAPISIDFLNDGSDTQSGDLGTTFNPNGLDLPGQVGAWHGVSPVSGTGYDTGSGTLTLSGLWSPWDNAPSTDSDLRHDVLSFNGAGTVSWTLSGLTPDTQYDLIFFGQWQDDAGSLVRSNPSAYSIGDGDPVTLDADYDGNFTDVVAVGGVISGKWESGGGTSSWSGMQFEQVPEPATMSLLAIGGVAMLRRRRRA